MRIISDFKDYYDSASAHGVDVTQVFERKLATIDMKTRRLSEENLKKCDCRNLISGTIENIGYRRDAVFKSSIFFFCGKSFPFVSLSYKGYTKEIKGINKEEYTFWDEDSVAHHIEKHHPDYFKNVFINKENKYSFQSKSLNKNEIGKHFHQQNVDTFLSELSHEIGSPYFSVELKKNSRPSYLKSEKEVKIEITKNIKLLDIDFQKVKDAFTCFQDISQYCFGVLSNIESSGSDIDDKYKVEGKGFDSVYGFRTRPGAGKKDIKKKK